jgi:multidrug resistance protein MdtO
MRVVFDWIWPVRTVTVMQRILASVLNNAAELVSLDITDSSGAWIDQEKRLRRQIGSNLATLRGLDETVEYDLGADISHQAISSDLIVQASLSIAALAWSQALFLNEVAEDIGAADKVRLELRKSISADLVSMSAAVDPRKGDAASFQLNPTTLGRYPSGEYERTIIARYENIRTLIAALLQSEMSQGSISLVRTAGQP